MAEKISLAALEAAITAYSTISAMLKSKKTNSGESLLAASWLLYIRQAILTSGKNGIARSLGVCNSLCVTIL